MQATLAPIKASVDTNISIPHPNPKSTVSLLLTEHGFFHMSRDGGHEAHHR
jgi:hypothetical protein